MSGGETSSGVGMAAQRTPHHFSRSVSTVTAVACAHAFDNEVILVAAGREVAQREMGSMKKLTIVNMLASAVVAG